MPHLLLQSQTYLAPPEPTLNKNGTDSNNTLTLNNSKWSFFFLMWMSCKESLSTVSHILWWLSNNRHPAGGRGLEENSSDISVKHTVRAAVSSLPLEPAVHSEPGWASCPIISLLTWRSRYKRTNNMRINYNHISSLSSFQLNMTFCVQLDDRPATDIHSHIWWNHTDILLNLARGYGELWSLLDTPGLNLSWFSSLNF